MLLNLKKETDVEMLSQILKPILKNNYKEMIDSEAIFSDFKVQFFNELTKLKNQKLEEEA